MNCLVCSKRLDPTDTLTDGQGIEMRVHQACASSLNDTNLLNPDYQPAKGRVVMPPKQEYHYAPAPDFQGGKAVWHEPTRKADASLLETTIATPKCILCGQKADSEDKHSVKGVTVYAHNACIQARAAKLGLSSGQTNQSTAISQKGIGNIIHKSNTAASRHEQAKAAAEAAYFENRRLYGDAMRKAGIDW